MPDDFDTAFEAAWSGGDKAPDVVTPASVDTDPAPATAAVDAPVDPKPAAEGRDEKGRFAPKAADPAATKSTAPVVAKEVPAATSPAPGAVDAPKDYAAGRLTADEKGLLDKLQPEAAVLVRQVLARQEAVHTRRMQEVAKGREAFAAIENVIAPRRAAWARHGTSDAQAVANLLQVEDAFLRDPKGTLQWLARTYNVDLGAASTADPATDQTVNQPWQGEISGLRTTVHQLQQQLQATQQATVGQQVASLDRLVTQFQASHPHKDYLPLVEDRIPSLISQLRATQPELSNEELLTQAYDAALWANPQTRAVLIDAQLAASRASTSEAAKVHAQKARVAGASVNGGTAIAGPAARSSLSDIISAAMSDL